MEPRRIPGVGTVYTLGDGCLVFASRRCWRPGVFRDMAALRVAVRMDDAAIQAAQDRVSPRALTVEDLRRSRPTAAGAKRRAKR